jgi:hypothetical protein
MRTDLDHLPEAKRRELERVVQILFEEFEAKTRNRSQQHLKQGRILKVVLFGSHARGDWAATGASETLLELVKQPRQAGVAQRRLRHS